MADEPDNMLTGNPAILARKIAEDRVPQEDRGPHWQQNWDEIERHCDEPVRLVSLAPDGDGWSIMTERKAPPHA